MIYFVLSMTFFLILAYIIYYRYTIQSKIFLSTQLVKLGVYARIYNYFEEKTTKDNAALFAEVINDELFSETERREKSVLFHVINKDEILKYIYKLSQDLEMVEMVNIGLYAEAVIKIKNGISKEDAMKKLKNLEKYGFSIKDIDKRYPLKIIMFRKASKFYRLTKTDAAKTKTGSK